MDDIADAAEVGKGTLYRYFKDKDELYLAVLDWDAEQYVARLRSVAAVETTATGQLIALIRTIIEHFDDQPHLLALIQRAEVTQTSDKLFSWLQVRNEALQLIAEVFRRAEANNEFHVADPDLATTMLLGGLRSVIRFGPMPRPADLAERIVQGFLTGAARHGQ
jgi:AcrR family transcriptional regulator